MILPAGETGQSAHHLCHRLGAGGQALLEANWPGIYACARDICADPAARQGLLDDAGVTGDLAALDLDGVPARLDAMNEALGG